MNPCAIARVTLDTLTASRLARRMATLAPGLPYTDVEYFLQSCQSMVPLVLDPVRRALGTLGRGQMPALLIRGWPRDDALPPTPHDARADLTKDPVSEACLALVSLILGEPVGYLQDQHGVVFRQVCPTRTHATWLSEQGSERAIGFHVENTFHPLRPDFVALYCLRADPERQAVTKVAAVRALLARLSEEDRALASQAVFETGIDIVYGGTPDRRGGGPCVALLSGRPDDPQLCVDPELMAGRTPAAERLLDAMSAHLDAVADQVWLTPGDLLVIDNARAAHDRTPFAARYDGTDRWLQRCLIRRTLPSVGIHRHKGSRVICTPLETP